MARVYVTYGDPIRIQGSTLRPVSLAYALIRTRSFVCFFPIIPALCASRRFTCNATPSREALAGRRPRFSRSKSVLVAPNYTLSKVFSLLARRKNGILGDGAVRTAVSCAVLTCRKVAHSSEGAPASRSTVTVWQRKTCALCSFADRAPGVCLPRTICGGITGGRVYVEGASSVTGWLTRKMAPIVRACSIVFTRPF